MTATLSTDRYEWSARLHAALKTIDPDDLAPIAARYQSGESFVGLVTLARESEVVCELFLEEGICGIAMDCEEDGSAYGFIPLLGGRAREIWNDCLDWVIQTGGWD